jgi:hypothetical protein
MQGISEIEDKDCTLVEISKIGRLTPFWYEGELWIRVPGYKEYCTNIRSGEQKLLPSDAMCDTATGT